MSSESSGQAKATCASMGQALFGICALICVHGVAFSCYVLLVNYLENFWIGCESRFIEQIANHCAIYAIIAD